MYEYAVRNETPCDVMSTAVAAADPSSHEDMDLLAHFTSLFFIFYFFFKVGVFFVFVSFGLLRSSRHIYPLPPPKCQQHDTVLYVRGKDCKQLSIISGTVPPFEQTNSHGGSNDTHEHTSKIFINRTEQKQFFSGKISVSHPLPTHTVHGFK